MKKFFASLAAVALVAFVSCNKQQTEAEKNAEIERQVQERLAAEHQTQQQKELEQRQADLDAREKALAEKENATPTAQTGAEQTESESVESRPRAREPRESGPARGYSTFYTRLDSYGDWIDTGDYGYVFHPREAESSRWRPYTNGRWVYTDAGCTWISQEPFGWATYHYGRWTRLRGIGWVWVPGNEWAPAWVSWRKSNDYVGWAPLPPEARFDQRTGIHTWSDNYYEIGPDQYCFVASREFGAPRVEQTLLPSERNVTIINQTTNVTNITYKNTTIVNEGPSYDEMRSISREPVQRFRLERNVNVDVSTEPPRPDVRGETVVIAAPVIAAPQLSERPRTVKQNIAQVSVDLGWAAITNQEEAKKARQKMKAEATPPPNAPSKKFVKAAAATSAQVPATSTSAAATSSPSVASTQTPAATVAPTSRPETTMTPQRRATVAPTTTAISSPAVSPTAAQRRGRLLVPSATPTPRATTTSTPVASKPAEVISSPSPSATPIRQFTPRATAPMRSPSASPTPRTSSAEALREGGSTSTPEPPAAAANSPAEKLTRKEKKEEKREERKELKRERKAEREGAPATPSATP